MSASAKYAVREPYQDSDKKQIRNDSTYLFVFATKLNKIYKKAFRNNKKRSFLLIWYERALKTNSTIWSRTHSTVTMHSHVKIQILRERERSYYDALAFLVAAFAMMSLPGIRVLMQTVCFQTEKVNQVNALIETFLFRQSFISLSCYRHTHKHLLFAVSSPLFALLFNIYCFSCIVVMATARTKIST